MLVMLNGTSSSGKSSVLAHLQSILEEPFLNASIDKFIFMLPARFLDRPLWDDILGKANASGQQGHILFSGMHHALAALVQRGNNVLVDHVLVEQQWAQECASLLANLPAYLIGIRCPLAVVEQREIDRQDRTLGQARLQFDSVHAYTVYDYEIDTSVATAQECAQSIKAFLVSGAQPYAFREMRTRR